MTDKKDGSKKNKGEYGSLIWIMIGIFVVPITVGIVLEGRVSEDLLTRLILLSTFFLIWIMALIIRNKKRLYWINMYSYKQVADMPEELVESLCESFYRIFTAYFIGYTVLTIIGAWLEYNIISDIVVFTLGTVVMAIHSYVKLAIIQKEYRDKIE